jgi:putative transposase
MRKDTMKEAGVAADPLLFDDWFDAIEDGVRSRVRGFIEAMVEEELSGTLSRPRYGRRKPGADDAAPLVVGVRHGHRERTLTGTFGKTRIAVPRARLMGVDGRTSEWRSASLRAYQRRTRAADALIAGAYLSGTNTRRVRRALAAVFAGPVGKDVVSRAWRKVKGDWDAWNARPLGEEAPGLDPIGANISGPCIDTFVFFAGARADVGATPPGNGAGKRGSARA